MKNFTWKQWTAIGIVVAYIVALIVLAYTAPTTMFFGLGSLAIGIVATLFFKSKKDGR